METKVYSENFTDTVYKNEDQTNLKGWPGNLYYEGAALGIEGKINPNELNSGVRGATNYSNYLISLFFTTILITDMVSNTTVLQYELSQSLLPEYFSPLIVDHYLLVYTTSPTVGIMIFDLSDLNNFNQVGFLTLNSSNYKDARIYDGNYLLMTYLNTDHYYEVYNFTNIANPSFISSHQFDIHLDDFINGDYIGKNGTHINSYNFVIGEMPSLVSSLKYTVFGNYHLKLVDNQLVFVTDSNIVVFDVIAPHSYELNHDVNIKNSIYGYAVRDWILHENSLVVITSQGIRLYDYSDPSYELMGTVAIPTSDLIIRHLSRFVIPSYSYVYSINLHGDKPHSATSKVISVERNAVISAKISADYVLTEGDSIEFYVSNKNGAEWISISENQNYVFENRGYELVWRIILISNTLSTFVSQINISYEVDLSLTQPIVNGLDVWSVGSYIDYEIVIENKYDSYFFNQDDHTIEGKLRVYLDDIEIYPESNLALLSFRGTSQESDIQNIFLDGQADGHFTNAVNESIYTNQYFFVDYYQDYYSLHQMYNFVYNFKIGGETRFIEEFPFEESKIHSKYNIIGKNDISLKLNDENTIIPYWQLEITGLTASYLDGFKARYHEETNSSLGLSTINGVMMTLNNTYYVERESDFFFSTSLEMEAVSVSDVRLTIEDVPDDTEISSSETSSSTPTSKINTPNPSNPDNTDAPLSHTFIVSLLLIPIIRIYNRRKS